MSSSSATLWRPPRGEKNPARLQAYVSIFEEYFTYWNASQKQQTLDFLYELLLIPDGDIRRRAAALIGRILAAFRLGYQKEPPADAPPDPEEDLPFQLWAEYLEKLIDPGPAADAPADQHDPLSGQDCGGRAADELLRRRRPPLCRGAVPPLPPPRNWWTPMRPLPCWTRC